MVGAQQDIVCLREKPLAFCTACWEYLGRARLHVESALWSHVCVIIVVEDPPPLAGYPPPKLYVMMQAALWSHVWVVVMEDPPPWLATPPPRDGWLGRSASALTKRTCFNCRQLSDKNDNNVTLQTANRGPATEHTSHALMNGEVGFPRPVPGELSLGRAAQWLTKQTWMAPVFVLGTFWLENGSYLLKRWHENSGVLFAPK